MTTAVARNSSAVRNLVKTAIQRCSQQNKNCVHTRPTVVYKGPRRRESPITPFHSAALDAADFAEAELNYESHQHSHLQMSMSPKPSDCKAGVTLSSNYYDEDYDEQESHMSPSHVTKHKCCETDLVFLSHHSLTDPRPAFEDNGDGTYYGNGPYEGDDVDAQDEAY